tara:strand:- start:567 stop:1202 length:636 start_codon:yes stop_codon:yes gene_type:complete
MKELLFNKKHICVAVSKTKPVSAIKKIYDLGHRDFGENKVQELISKQEEMPKDIKWHMIGHLQSNKVKKVLPLTYLIHSVDSFKLIKTIDKESKKLKIKSNILMQLNISGEERKYGFSYEDAQSVIDENFKKEFSNIRLKGFMGMATFTDDKEIIINQFNGLNQFYIKNKYKIKSIEILSMGMSNDYKLALECGSNMIRIGSKIFGERNYL